MDSLYLYVYYDGLVRDVKTIIKVEQNKFKETYYNVTLAPNVYACVPESNIFQASSRKEAEKICGARPPHPAEIALQELVEASEAVIKCPGNFPYTKIEPIKSLGIAMNKAKEVLKDE